MCVWLNRKILSWLRMCDDQPIPHQTRPRTNLPADGEDDQGIEGDDTAAYQSSGEDAFEVSAVI